MKDKFRKILIAILTLLIIITGNINIGSVAFASGEATGIMLSELMDKDALIIIPGETKHIRVPIKAIGGSMNNANVEISAEKGPFNLSQAILSLKGDGTPYFNVSNYGTTFVEFDIDVKETAQIGNYPIKISVTSIDSEGGAYTNTMSLNAQVLEELAPAQVTISEVSVKDAIIGGETNIIFRIKNEGEITARNTYISLDYGTTNIVPKYVTPKIKVGDLAPGADDYLSLPIGILPTATVGLKTITINIEYKDVDGVDGKDANQIYADVIMNDKSPEIMIDNVIYEGDLEPGAKVDVTAILRNYGLSKAENVKIKVEGTGMGADGFIKNYYTDSLWIGSIKSDNTMEAKIPLTISKLATSGIKTLNIVISYEDAEGREYSSTITVYPEIIGAASSEDSGIVISNVKQSSTEPVAGGRIEVSFDIQNKNQVDISELKISMPSLDGTTFIPVKSEPYEYIELLKAGATKRITIPLTISESIQEGLNNLVINYTYATSKTDNTVKIPIRNVRNDLDSSSTPKLIVSKYITDMEELRAGTTFNFTFDIYNTNSSVAAKNITVTVTQPDNIFTVTQGSNSFFINKIEAGETVQNTLELKVKSDASTKAYPIKIVIEYEYDGIKPNPETGKTGETKTEELNLQAVENSRPVVDYVNVYSWDGNVIVGNTATLAFEFYNMGRSPLNNVIATVEGDLTKADGNMYFIGNVLEGSSTYAEFEVIPNMEGVAKGVLKITFEDSNGDEVEFIKEFETQVMGAGVFDPGIPVGGEGEVFNPEAPLAKKAIVPMWVFVIIQIISFIIFMLITRKIIISAYKSKLRKQEQEQY